VSKKTKKPRRNRKKITEKTELEKKPIKILKKPTGSVRFSFGFISLKPKKTEPNRTQTEKNRAKIEPN
jgi:hypothetical protein